jgi:hypothetical protein
MFALACATLGKSAAFTVITGALSPTVVQLMASANSTRATMIESSSFVLIEVGFQNEQAMQNESNHTANSSEFSSIASKQAGNPKSINQFTQSHMRW